MLKFEPCIWGKWILFAIGLNHAFGENGYFLPLGTTPKTGVSFIAKKITVTHKLFNSLKPLEIIAKISLKINEILGPIVVITFDPV